MKKVLIITYYWPPAGGSGVLRWLKFTKYLREFGWEPVIYTTENGEYPEYDDSLAADIPAGAVVLRRKIWEPYAMYKRLLGTPKGDKINVGFLSEKEKPARAERLSRWVRGNLFIPDARRLWIRPSARFLTRWLKENKVDAIASTGPPHSMHLIAARVARKTGLPWLADFRDPWTDIDFYEDLRLTRWADRIHHRQERKVLAAADDVVLVGPYMAERFWTKYRRQYRVITNGYDENDLIESREPSMKEFVVLHAGSLGPGRNAPGLWKAIGMLAKENAVFREQLKIRLLGNADHSVLCSISDEGLEQSTERADYIAHSGIIGEMSAASLLLLCINRVPNSRGIITGKIFEYLLSRRPILCIGPEDGDAARIIADTKSGITLDDSKVEAIKLHLAECFDLHQKGSLQVDTSSSIKAYSRKTLTAKLADALDLIAFIKAQEYYK